jgi:hypothetical protein
MPRGKRSAEIACWVHRRAGERTAGENIHGQH